LVIRERLYTDIEFSAEQIGLAAKARLSDDLLQNPTLTGGARARQYYSIEGRQNK
jgi:hypothetical protein